MRKVGSTYNKRKKASASSRPGNGYGKRKKKNATPQWFSFTVIVLITFLLCLAINFRAFSELRNESSENGNLTVEIENLKTKNSELRNEIKDLKNDPNKIAREARKLGMSRPNEKILVPIN
ncbi:MAG: FtsB family cell division protein [Pyrinomonadaceae bacterium]